MFLPAIISLVLLLTAIVSDNYFPKTWLVGWFHVAFYFVAYIAVGLPVVREAFKSIRKGEIFSEFLLERV
jgi:Zn2+/Cd2+-exporting ATPase